MIYFYFNHRMPRTIVLYRWLESFGLRAGIRDAARLFPRLRMHT